MQEKAGKDEVSQCTSQNTTCEPFPTLFSQSRERVTLGQVTNRRHQANGRGEAYCSPCSLRAVLPEGIYGSNLVTRFQYSPGPHHHIIGQRGTGLHSTIIKWARKTPMGRAVDQTLSGLERGKLKVRGSAE